MRAGSLTTTTRSVAADLDEEADTDDADDVDDDVMRCITRPGTA